MIKEIIVLDNGVYSIDMHQIGTTSRMTLSKDNTILSKIDILSPIVQFDACIDSLLFNAGINEMWDYC